MITSNRITILVPDNAVYLDMGVYMGLDFSTCGIPSEVRALDWKNNQGEIHNNNTDIPHIKITELPEWAFRCLEKWEELYNQEKAQGLIP